MQPYYYMVYALRRMLGSDCGAGDFGEWRAIAFFLMIQVQLLIAAVAIFVADFFRQGNPIAWVLGVGIPVVIAIYWIVGKRGRYSRYAARFDSWPHRKRVMADVGASLFGVVALVAPFIARSLAG